MTSSPRIVALALLVVAASLATTLQFYRRRRQRARDSERALRPRRSSPSCPTADDLVLFSEDAARFYYGDRSIDKDLIAAVRVLINGSPIAAVSSRRQPPRCAPSRRPASRIGRKASPAIAGTSRIETVTGTVLVECGAIRERVSQELARAVFDAVKRDVEAAMTAALTTRSRARRPDD